LLNNVGYIFT